MLEGAPRDFRGGNSRHTRNLRCMHDAPTDVLTDAYSEEEYVADLLRVTGGQTNETLARMVVRASAGCPAWMRRFGVRFQPSLRGTLHLGRTNAFFLGGGKALMNSYYAAAERRGVRVLYDAEVVALDVADGRFTRRDRQRRRTRDRRCGHGPVVLASGGFESNLEWLKEIWGDAADNFMIRGTPYNRGTVLKLMLGVRRGAGRRPDAVSRGGDRRARAEVRRRHRHAPRLRLASASSSTRAASGSTTRAKTSGRSATRSGAVSSRSSPIRSRTRSSTPRSAARSCRRCFRRSSASSIRELASLLGLSPDALEATVTAFNRAVRPGTFDHARAGRLPDRGARPNKTHWAQAIDTPPFWGYPLRPGITFTYLGLKVDERARVLMTGGAPAENIFAAGEIMAGNVLGKGYVAGVGMTIGTVFGRIAGREAASHVAG